MRPTQHPSNNSVLGAPKGATIDECTALAITRVRYECGSDAVWSYWEPSAAERALIASGAKVRLCVMGVTHPPISIGVDGIDD